MEENDSSDEEFRLISEKNWTKIKNASHSVSKLKRMFLITFEFNFITTYRKDIEMELKKARSVKCSLDLIKATWTVFKKVNLRLNLEDSSVLSC